MRGARGEVSAEMTEMLEPTVASLGDEALLDLVREGDSSAWAELFRRHHEAATRMARGIDPSNADDLVSEAFTRVYLATSKGAGVRSAFRAYLFQTIRNLAVNRFRRDGRLMWVDDVSTQPFEVEKTPDVEERMTSEMLADAFRSLPARWQTVLWHTAVEGEDHRAVGELLGLKPNAVAALSFRAREGLRRAYIDAHVAASDVAECKEARRLVPGQVLGKLSVREEDRLDAHLAGCSPCTAVVHEIRSVNGRPGTALLPALVGPVLALGYVAKGGGSATTVTNPVPLFVPNGGHHTALALGGFALGLVIVGAGAVVAFRDEPSERSVAAGPTLPTSVLATASASGSATPSPSARDTGTEPAAQPTPRVPVPTSDTASAEPGTHAVPPSRTTPRGGGSPSPPPVITTRHDLSITGGSVTPYPDHQHLQLVLGPESAAAGVVIRLTAPGLESFVAHRRGEFRSASCVLTGADEVSCTLGEGTQDVAVDVVVTGDLAVVAQVEAPHNDDPVPGNNEWRGP